MEDNSIGELATEDATAAIQYAGCQRKHSSVVDIYNLWRDQIIAHVEKLRKEQQK